MVSSISMLNFAIAPNSVSRGVRVHALQLHCRGSVGGVAAAGSFEELSFVGVDVFEASAASTACVVISLVCKYLFVFISICNMRNRCKV